MTHVKRCLHVRWQKRCQSGMWYVLPVRMSLASVFCTLVQQTLATMEFVYAGQCHAFRRRHCCLRHPNWCYRRGCRTDITNPRQIHSANGIRYSSSIQAIVWNGMSTHGRVQHLLHVIRQLCHDADAICWQRRITILRSEIRVCIYVICMFIDIF